MAAKDEKMPANPGQDVLTTEMTGVLDNFFQVREYRSAKKEEEQSQSQEDKSKTKRCVWFLLVLPLLKY